MIVKKRYNLPFWSIVLSFVLGTFIFSTTVFQIPTLFTATLSLFAILVLTRKRQHSLLFTIITCLLFVCIGGLRYQLATPQNQPNHLIRQNKVTAVNRVIFNISKTGKKTNNWTSYEASIKQVNEKKVSGKILLKVKENIPQLQKGAAYVSNLKLIKLTNETFPYGFNFTKYLNQHGITHQAWITKNKPIPLPKYNNKWICLLTEFQRHLNERLKQQHLSKEVIQFTQAIVLGNKKELTQQLKVNFQNAGVIHILAISGLHIGILYFIFSWFLKKIIYKHKYRILRSLIILLFLWLFTWFSGGSDSALRATTMFSCFEISNWLLRRQHPLNALLVSVFVLVLISPTIIFSVGFQLSITAVASIIIGVPKLSKIWKPKWPIANYIWKIISVSLCAQIGLLPLSIYYFHQFPLLFLAANIPIMFCIPLIMAFAISIVMGSYFFIWNKTICTAYDILIAKLINFIDWIASLDSLILKELYISKLTMFAIYVIMLYARWCYSNIKSIPKHLSLPVALIVIIGFIEIHQKTIKKEIWLLNDYTNTTIIEMFSNGMHVFSEKKFMNDKIPHNVYTAEKTLHHSNIQYNGLKHIYTFNNKKLLLASENYIPNPQSPIYILLVTNTPKINFDRLLKEVQPQKVIFAANNAFYLISKWKKSCEERNISYYDVSKKGSVRIDNL